MEENDQPDTAADLLPVRNRGTHWVGDSMGHFIIIIIIIIIIMFIDCKWVDTGWQWSFNMLHMHGLWRLII